MQIRELLNIESLSTLKLLTGENGLDRNMKDVVLLEYESLKQDQPDYYKDDFIIATLFFAKDDPKALYSAVEQLINLGAAGLAFKSVYFDMIPQDIIDMAKAHQFPIFKFDNIYMEDVILVISDYIRQRQEFSQFEEPIFRILQGTSDAYGSIEQLCARMNPARQKYMCAAYIHSSDMSMEWTIPLKNALQLRTYRELTGGFRFLQFRRGFYVICNAPAPVPLQNVADNIMEILSQLGCDTTNVCIGVGSFYRKAEDFDIVIIEAFNTLLTALLRQKQIELYPNLKLYLTVFSITRDRSTRRAMLKLIGQLEKYDNDSTNGFLLPTLKAYSECRYDIKATATKLNQHPNTIRYRLKKICDLTASPDEYDHALFIIGEFIRAESLSSTIF